MVIVVIFKKIYKIQEPLLCLSHSQHNHQIHFEAPDATFARLSAAMGIIDLIVVNGGRQGENNRR